MMMDDDESIIACRRWDGMADGKKAAMYCGIVHIKTSACV